MNFKLMVGFCLLLSFSQLSFSGAEVSLQSVTVTGRGQTAQEALNTALAEAVGRVNGKTIAAENAINQRSIRASDNGATTSKTTKDLQRKYREASKGMIDSYVVIVEKQIEYGQWEVQVKANIAKIKLTGTSNRLKMAVLPFNINTNSINMQGQEFSSDQLSSSFSSALIDKLSSTRRFAMLDRDFTNRVMSEKNIGKNSTAISVADLARLGADLVADYFIVGTIQNLNYRVDSRFIKVLNRNVTFPVGNASVAYRVIDVPTGEIKFADNTFIRIDANELQRLYGKGMPPAVDIAVLELASEAIGNKVVDAIYPLLLAMISGKELTLNQGGSLIQKGDMYDIYERGAKVRDPYTKEFLGYQERKVGALKISNVTNKMSTAVLLSSDVDIEARFQPKRYVCRLAQKAKSGGTVSASSVKKQIQATKKKYDDDW